MKLNPPIARKLMLLRDLDDKIDFARSRLQLQIILAFMIEDTSFTASRLVDVLGERRKAVIDALRKLEAKGIIERGEKGYTYRLSKKGREYSEKLLSLLDARREQLTTIFDHDSTGAHEREGLGRDINELYYIKRAVIYLANKRNNIASLKELSVVMGLSRDRAKSYLDLYSRPPRRVFRRQTLPTKGSYYRLDKKGFTLYYKTYEYQKSKRNLYYRLKLKLYANPKLHLYKDKAVIPVAVGTIMPVVFSIIPGISSPIYLFSLPFALILFILALAP